MMSEQYPVQTLYEMLHAHYGEWYGGCRGEDDPVMETIRRHGLRKIVDYITMETIREIGVLPDSQKIDFSVDMCEDESNEHTIVFKVRGYYPDGQELSRTTISITSTFRKPTIRVKRSPEMTPTLRVKIDAALDEALTHKFRKIPGEKWFDFTITRV